MSKIGLKDSIKLRLCGHVVIDGKYYTRCRVHGISEAIPQGYYDNLYCLKCAADWRKQYESEIKRER